jgi:hypothetical protein
MRITAFSAGHRRLLSNPWEASRIEEILTAKSKKFLREHPFSVLLFRLSGCMGDQPSTSWREFFIRGGILD